MAAGTGGAFVIQAVFLLLSSYWTALIPLAAATRPTSRVMAVFIVTLWVLALGGFGWWAFRKMHT